MSKFLATMSARRAEIVANAVKLRGEIEQQFLDLAHWNAHVRKPSEPPIDADPGGELRALAARIDRMLEREFGPAVHPEPPMESFR